MLFYKTSLKVLFSIQCGGFQLCLPSYYGQKVAHLWIKLWSPAPWKVCSDWSAAIVKKRCCCLFGACLLSDNMSVLHLILKCVPFSQVDNFTSDTFQLILWTFHLFWYLTNKTCHIICTQLYGDYCAELNILIIL